MSTKGKGEKTFLAMNLGHLSKSGDNVARVDTGGARTQTTSNSKKDQPSRRGQGRDSTRH